MLVVEALLMLIVFVPEKQGFVVFECERWNCPCAGQVTSNGARGKRSLVDHSEHTHTLTSNIISDIVRAWHCRTESYKIVSKRCILLTTRI